MLQTLFFVSILEPAGKASLHAMDVSNPIKPATSMQHFRREEGASKFHPSVLRPGIGRGREHIKPPRPSARKIAAAIAPIMRNGSPHRIDALNEIAKLAGKRPSNWTKPRFGDFDYFLARNCGWISDEELAADTAAHEVKRQRARQFSQRFSMERFSWLEEARYAEPAETGEYAPQVDMKLIRDRNLTDSSRRIAMFVLQKAYQDNRSQRFIGMTVSFIMKGLSLSRRTVQRSLTLLETRGYFRCEVAKGDTTRMCVGLIIHLMGSLFPKHHREKWPAQSKESKRSKNGGNPAASSLPQKQIQFYKTIYKAKHRISRLSWTLKCMNAITDRALQELRFTKIKLQQKHAPTLDHSLKGEVQQ